MPLAKPQPARVNDPSAQSVSRLLAEQAARHDSALLALGEGAAYEAINLFLGPNMALPQDVASMAPHLAHVALEPRMLTHPTQTNRNLVGTLFNIEFRLKQANDELDRRLEEIGELTREDIRTVSDHYFSDFAYDARENRFVFSEIPLARGPIYALPEEFFQQSEHQPQIANVSEGRLYFKSPNRVPTRVGQHELKEKPRSVRFDYAGLKPKNPEAVFALFTDAWNNEFFAIRLEKIAQLTSGGEAFQMTQAWTKTTSNKWQELPITPTEAYIELDAIRLADTTYELTPTPQHPSR